MQVVSPVREPLITGKKTMGNVTDDISRQVIGKPTISWMLTVGFVLGLLTLGMISLYFTLFEGIGMWGLNKTIGWAWDITNFVWWIGIGHAGTLISAILLLFRQKWRNSINRSAEAMTIFAVMCAGLFPLIHMGRPWVGFYWVFPLPNTFGSLWINFNSPLLWDVFAISTYFIVSLVFWYIGLIPDLATIREKVQNKVSKFIYGILSFGWIGSVKDWQRYEQVSLILAGIATPLVLSVHSVVSMDFATTLVPGWHTTIFPPYFVAGAMFSGFAMVLTLMLITRKVFKLENYITRGHVESMNKIIILTGSIVGIAYITEFFIAWYSGVPYEYYAFINRATGPYWWAYAIMMTCNVLSPQLFWIKKIRRGLIGTFILSIVINIGMWFERFVIIVTSLHREYLPSGWAMFYPTLIDMGDFLFSLAFFFLCFLLFAKVLPVINMWEVKSILKSSSDRVNGKEIGK